MGLDKDEKVSWCVSDLRTGAVSGAQARRPVSFFQFSATNPIALATSAQRTASLFIFLRNASPQISADGASPAARMRDLNSGNVKSFLWASVSFCTISGGVSLGAVRPNQTVVVSS